MKTIINTLKKHIGYLNFLILFLITIFIGCGNVTESYEKPEAPVASFNYDMGQNLTVQFDASGSSDPDGRIASYRWDFGDDTTDTGAMHSHIYSEAGTNRSGAMSRRLYREADATVSGATPARSDSEADSTETSATPSHTYREAGKYTVMLTVTDDDGAIDTTSQQVSVEAPNQAPSAAFSFAAKDLLVQFEAGGSDDSDGNIASYHWDFGDEANGSGVSPEHTYSGGGTYTVTLTVTDNEGASDTASKEVSVQAPNQAPSATFTFTTTDLLAVFDAGGSSDTGGHIDSYHWDFGDSKTGTGVNPKHTYSETGTYTVSLTVTDNDGATDAASQQVSVQAANQGPSAAFTFTTADLSAEFDAGNSSDADGSITSYSWNYGDGASGSGATPGHTYSEAGKYNVTLTVTDDDGATDTANQQVSVKANPAPSAAFTFTTTDLLVQFDAGSSSDAGGHIVSYRWDFGDEATGSGVSPQHTYSRAGKYTVTLMVTDDDGVTDTASQQVSVQAPNQAPSAAFTFTTADLSAEFDAGGSSDPDGRIASYRWNFGDGASESGVSPAHVYSEAGTFTVTLTVTDNDAATDVTGQQVSVQAPNQAPSAAFTFTKDDLSVEFDAGGSDDSDGSIASYIWDFGDGANGSDENPQHTYVEADTYTVTLKVTDDDGATDTASQQVSVEANEPPSATFKFKATDLLAKFDAGGSSDSDGNIDSYHWEFGDGKSGSGVSPEHMYAEAGKYTVTLTVTDNDGAADTAEKKVTVEAPNQGPSAAFTFTKDDLSAEFDAGGSSDADGSIDTYHWNFGDGANGSGISASHTYSAASTYTVTLTVTDNDGATDTDSKEVSVLANQAPSAAFTFTATDLLVEFDAGGSSDSDGGIAFYRWDFGDAESGTGKSPPHTYAKAGTYTVKLTVTDNDGASDDISKEVTVEAPNQAPSAAFTFTATDLLVQFDASSSSDTDGNIASYRWDFGDGSPAGSGVTPSHTYSGTGTYTVTLTVTDDDEASDDISKEVTVEAPNQAPTAAFAITVTALSVRFDASSSGDSDGRIDSYHWDFGDEESGSGAKPHHDYREAGKYTVTLKVTDNDGATDTAIGEVTVKDDNKGAEGDDDEASGAASKEMVMSVITP